MICGGGEPRFQLRHVAREAVEDDAGRLRALACAAAVRLRRGVTQLLYMVRRYSAKLLYEIEFHSADDPTQLSNRYVELLGDALKIEPSAADYLADIDSSFYVTGYLRSWAFEAQFRTHMRERFGNDWFTKREAGSLVRELWETGMSMTADEILNEVAGQELEMDAVAQLTRGVLTA